MSNVLHVHHVPADFLLLLGSHLGDLLLLELELDLEVLFSVLDVLLLRTHLSLVDGIAAHHHF